MVSVYTGMFVLLSAPKREFVKLRQLNRIDIPPIQHLCDWGK